jgi:hypothetical protein
VTATLTGGRAARRSADARASCRRRVGRASRSGACNCRRGVPARGLARDFR